MFTAPGFAVFTDLLAGWVLTPGRRTITRMLSVADPHGRRAHDAYHRFVRVGRWNMTALWRVLAVHAVAVFAPAAVVVLDCDDTVYKKTGRAVNGAGTFRDAVRSTRNRVVYAWGLNLVIITLRVTAPWGGCPLGLPINMRMHRKGGPTPVELSAQMIAEIAGWLPGSLPPPPTGSTPTSTNVAARDVLWYRPCPRRLVRLVVVRDPTGTQPDDFFVTSAPVHDPPGTGFATVTLRSTRRPEKHSAT